MKNLTLVVILIINVMGFNAQAHEFWLEAEPFQQKLGSRIDISIHVGQKMGGEVLPNIPAWYKKFDVITQNGLKEVEGEMGSDPAGSFYSDIPGVYAFGFLSTETEVDLDPKKFKEYLHTQGLEKIIEQRAKLGESNKVSREVYSRNVKTLVKVGQQNQVNFYDYDFGYPLNITPLSDPYDARVGDNLQFKVTFNQKIIPNILVKALNKSDKDYEFQQRTDENGLVTIPFPKAGVWMIHTVNMIRSDYDDIEWESFWSSITFELN